MRFGGSVIQGTKDRGAGRFRFWHLGTAAQRLGEGVAMFGIGPATRIYLALGATDMRKGFEGRRKNWYRKELELSEKT